MNQRRQGTMLMIAVVSAALSACQPSRQAFQMDSDSRTPMLGLEFAPKKPSADVTGISNRAASEIRTVPGASSRTQPVDEAEPPSGWSKLWGKLTPAKRIPLPRTDSRDDGSNENSRPADSAADPAADFT